MSKQDRAKEKRQRNRYKKLRADKRYMAYVKFVRQGLQMGEPMTDELLEQRNKEWALLQEAQGDSKLFSPKPCHVCGETHLLTCPVCGETDVPKRS
jgi:hypothetical protein